VTHDETAARFHSAGLTQRFNSLADAQRFADEGLLAQHIYGGLTDRKSQGNGVAAVGDGWPSKLDYGPTS
jgi:hypothetical protein